MTKTNYDILDITKIILSILIVCIHTEILPDICYPVLRMAVPLFFIISSYLFFSKVSAAETEDVQNGMLKRYIIRNIKLYLFYFILTLPITIMKRKWYSYGVMGVIMFLRALFFGSTFVASWYIIASIIGTTIVFFLSRKLNPASVMIIGFFSYLIGCIASNYYYLFHGFGGFSAIMDVFGMIFPSSYACFWVSIIWISIGKSFALKTPDTSNNKLILYLLFSVVLLYAERGLVIHYNFVRENDCYLMLIPVCSCLFLILMKINIGNIKCARTLRGYSTMIYAFHGSLLPILRKFVERINISDVGSSYLLFVFTLALCCVYGFIVLKFEKHERLKWLKYAH